MDTQNLKSLIDKLSNFYIENQDNFANEVMKRQELKDWWYEIDTMENARYMLQEINYEWDYENTIRESAYLKWIQDTIFEIKQHFLPINNL